MTNDRTPYTQPDSACPERSRSEDLYTQNDPENTKPTSSISASSQIQKLDLESGPEQPQNGAKPATKQGQGGGPKTKRGKEASARRSTKHGVLSRNPVIVGERRRDWEAHVAGILQALAPQGHLERKLAGRVALAIWQLERLDRYVQAVTTDFIDNPRHGGGDGDDVAASVRRVIFGVGGQLAPERFDDVEAAAPGPGPDQDPGLRIIPDKPELKKIIRYEAHLHRLIDRTIRLLEALQSDRFGRKVHLYRRL